MDRRGQYIGQGRRYYSRHSRLRPGMRPRPGFSEKSMSMLRPGVSMYPDWMPIRRNDRYYYSGRSNLRLGTRADPRSAYRGRFVAQDTYSQRRNAAYAEPQQEPYNDGYAAPEQENYGGAYAAPEQENYGSAYAEPRQDGYGSAYAEPRQEGYGSAYAEPRQDGYGSAYAEPQQPKQEAYSAPQPDPYAGGQQSGYSAYSAPQQDGYGSAYANPQSGYSHATNPPPEYTAYSSPQQEPYGNPFANRANQNYSYGNSPYGSPNQSSSYQPNGYARTQEGPYGSAYANQQQAYQGTMYGAPQDFSDDRFHAYASEPVKNTTNPFTQAPNPFAQGQDNSGNFGFDYAVPPQGGGAPRPANDRPQMSGRGKMRANPFRLVLAGICFAATVFCAYQAGSIILERWENQRYISSLTTAWVQTNTRTSSGSSLPSLLDTQTGEGEVGTGMVEANPDANGEIAPISVNFGALQAVNPDVVAWIYCPDTVISYPVAQAKDNDTYLHRLLSGKDNDSGTIFMDYRCFSDFSDPNTIIYGHNMRDKSMFGTIDQYVDQSYYDQHPVMYLLTPTGDYKVNLVAGYVTPADGDIYTIPLAENGVAQVVANAMANSTFASQTAWNEGDKLLTMSTCSYEYEDARYVLMGVMEPLG